MIDKQNMSYLVNVKSVIPSIEIELKYATHTNFVGQRVYNFNTCYLLDEVAERLKEIQKKLNVQALGLKIWDGYRPMYAQEEFWRLMPDERYVAHPKKGSRHTRGTAVDLTVIDFLTKKELEMPSQFDDFSEAAHIEYYGASKTAIQNRELLIHIMQEHGFEVWHNEWWHFDLNNWQNYPVLDFLPT